MTDLSIMSSAAVHATERWEVIAHARLRMRVLRSPLAAKLTVQAVTEGEVAIMWKALM